MKYKGYTIEVSQTKTQFGSKIAFIKQGGLTVHKVIDLTTDKAIEASQKWIDWRLVGTLEEAKNG